MGSLLACSVRGSISYVTDIPGKTPILIHSYFFNFNKD